MERKLASIQRIIKLEPITGANLIEKANVLGWELVVKKGEFKEGELCIYCEIDSILPEKTEFEFLRERKFRIKTIKLKGQISQGICFPLSILPKNNYYEGDDVTETIGIKKYDPQVEIERKLAEQQSLIYKNRIDKFFRKYSWYRKLIFKPNRLPFPSFIKKTDEDRIQLFPNICEKEKDTIFEVTEKLDGQSATYFGIRNNHKWQFWKPFIFGVCSRNFQLLKEDNSSYWSIARSTKIKEILFYMLKANKSLKYFAIQGEIIGQGIQGNKYNKSNYELYIFNVIKDGKYYSSEEVKEWCFYSFNNCVPIINFEQPNLPSINDWVEYSRGKSQLYDIPKEGIIVRNVVKNISFKVINPDFLLNYE